MVILMRLGLILTLVLGLNILGISLNSSIAFAEIVPAKNATFESMEWVATPAMKKRFRSYFYDLMGKPWDVVNFKIKVDQISKELFSSGYFSSVVKFELAGTETLIIPRLTIEAKDIINFQFEGNTIFSHQQLRAKLLDKIKNGLGKINRGDLGSFINEVYEDEGFFNTSVQSYQNEGRNLEGTDVRNYFFIINEGNKLKVSSLSYLGNIILSKQQLDELFKKNATTLAVSGFYDRNFFENYSELIKNEYLSRGFVFAEISKPKVIANDEEDSLSIEYDISEKQQVVLKNIVLNSIDSDLQDSVKKLLTNKEGEPLNVVELDNDFKKIVTSFQEKGYYFASIANLNSDSLLVYDKSFTSAEIRPDVLLDRKTCFNNTVVNGNLTTQSQVILREVNIEKGELVTPGKIEKIRQRLSSLGLFSSLRITPYMIYEGDEKSCAKTNLLVQVKEKDFGLGEIAPGYRTDLGYKFSTGVTYNNLNGMNRSVSLKGQTNLRSNLNGFDMRRKNEDKKFLESSLKALYAEPYLWHDMLKAQLEFELSTTFQRKRFTSFDADIFRISPQVSKSFNQNISTAVRYQFERISQFDATIAVNNDNFFIGGVIPSITWDLRDDPVNPKKGTYFTLSSEWANHYFGSMKTNDLEVDYVKIISRNRAYIPMGDFTLALSLAMGYEKNFADEILVDPISRQPRMNVNGVARTIGYIPSIKVFRLDGYDEIRGYDEGEINRVISGRSIGDLVVQDEAYFVAFKFEPRYNFNDFMQFDVFFDAGRLFVNNLEIFNLRTSVGAGVKFLTPVGSLDFDYGVKLQRKSYPDAKRDSTGRFHLSIGFF